MPTPLPPNPPNRAYQEPKVESPKQRRLKPLATPTDTDEHSPAKDTAAVKTTPLKGGPDARQ